MVCFELFKGCLPQILRGLFLNTLPHIIMLKPVVFYQKLTGHLVYDLRGKGTSPGTMLVVSVVLSFSKRIEANDER